MSVQFNLYAHAMGANPDVARKAAQQLRDALDIPMHTNDVDRLRANGMKVLSNVSKADISQVILQIEAIGIDLRVVDAQDQGVIGILWQFSGNGPGFDAQLANIDFSGRSRAKGMRPPLPNATRQPNPSGPETVALSLSSPDDATPTGFTTSNTPAAIDEFNNSNDVGGGLGLGNPADGLSLRLGPDLNNEHQEVPIPSASGLSIGGDAPTNAVDIPSAGSSLPQAMAGALSLDLPPGVPVTKAPQSPTLANNTFKPGQKSRRGRVSLTQQTGIKTGKVTVERGPLLPFALALVLGAVGPWFYSEMEMANSIHVLREDLATARAHGDLTEVGKVYRKPGEINSQLQKTIYRSMAKTGLIWLGGFLLLFAIFRTLLS